MSYLKTYSILILLLGVLLPLRIFATEPYVVITYKIDTLTLENGNIIKVKDDTPIKIEAEEHSPIVSAGFSFIETPVDKKNNRLASKIRYRDKLTHISHNTWGIILPRSDVSTDKNNKIFNEIVFQLNSSDEKNKSEFDELSIFGWKIRVQEDLQKDYPLKRKALQSIRRQLQKITVKLPHKAQDQLRTVPILVYKNKPYESNKAIAYYDPKYRAVVFHNASKLNSLSDVRNAVVLHELAHGYHHIALGFNYKPIIQAYDNAVKLGLYTNVKSTYNGGLTPKAYALTNAVEYFAEITESYFASPAEKFGNDYFPFNRFELRNYDRMGYNLLEKIWKK